MDSEKKKIIVSEINYWKNNKLLPDTYCDFLLALYTEGNQDELLATKPNAENRFTFLYGILYGFMILSLFCTVLFTYFTEKPTLMQIAIAVTLLTGSILVIAYFTRKGRFFQVPLSLTFVQILFISLAIGEVAFAGSHVVIGLIVLVNCLLWLVVGWKFNYMYLTVSGVIGMIFYIFSIFM
ncbi:hypothetical protein [Bacillus weihaiensis]|uniref:hypothetical protein n=1 Tax=Bacillus weihaiensis TaxID=1547283 RepID=UPI002357DD4A|nr:hypothetical protein [Bacillus weihaiensis]